MAGLVPAIHGSLTSAPKTWMPGTSPGMTKLVRRAPQDEGSKGYVFFSAGFFAKVDFTLSNSSTFTPFLRMMKLCCSTESRLFHAQ